MPVLSSHLIHYRELGVHQRIRNARLRKGYTLAQLATRLSVSQAKLSQIETGKVRLDLAELAALAKALDLPLAHLFPSTRKQNYLVRRGDELAATVPAHRELEGVTRGPTTHHNAVRPLADPFIGRHMDPVLGQIHPLADADLQFISHDYEEFMFVLRGEVESLVKTGDGMARERLRPGDSLYFRSCLPHCHRSLGGVAETLHVMHTLKGASYPDEGDYGTLVRRFFRSSDCPDSASEASYKIARLRRAHGATLEELAHDVGIGVRQLAQIERGDKAVDLEILLRLARRFNRPIEYFCSASLETPPYYFVQRGAALAEVPPRQRKEPVGPEVESVVYRPLAVGFPNRGMHPYYLQTKTVPRGALRPHAHHGEEFVYVLEGEVEFVIHGEEGEAGETLRPGDCLFLDSSVPHLLRSEARNPLSGFTAEVIDVFYSPLGEAYLFDV